MELQNTFKNSGLKKNRKIEKQTLYEIIRINFIKLRSFYLFFFLFISIQHQKKKIIISFFSQFTNFFFYIFKLYSQNSSFLNQFCMDDLFLYNHIKKAIKERKENSKNIQQGNFAQKYCRRQLMKKKLNLTSTPIHHSNKMRALMKNFSHVDTYVDLNQLLYSINLIRSKQLAQKKIQKVQQKQRLSRLFKFSPASNIQGISNFSYFHRQNNEKMINQSEIDPLLALKDRLNTQINLMIKRKYQNENNYFDELIQSLQQQSNLPNSFLKNNSSNYIAYLNQELQKIQRDEQLDGQSCPENQKIFKQLTQNINKSDKEKEEKKEFFHSTNLNSKQKKQQNQLLHKISTFLQLALQTQHKQKWATKQMKKFRSTHGSFRFKKNNAERSTFFLKGVDMEKQNKQVFQNKKQQVISRSSSKKNTFKKNSVFMKKIKSQQRNIFGKRSLDKDNFNLLKLSNQFHETQDSKKNDNVFQKQMPQQRLFKTFQGFERTQIRNTAPLLRSNVDGQLTEAFEQIYPSSKVQKQENKQKISSLIIKKQYQLNKRRKNRQFNFVFPQDSRQQKSLILGNAGNIEYQKNNSYNQFFENKKNKLSALVSTISPQNQTKSFLQSLNNSQPKKNSLSETFTFKKRNKKQQILNKLQSFIDQINNEEKISKMQNEYYDSAINKLHDISKSTFQNYEPQTLAGQQEINQLKKFVNNINPVMKKSHSNIKSLKKGLR